MAVVIIISFEINLNLKFFVIKWRRKIFQIYISCLLFQFKYIYLIIYIILSLYLFPSSLPSSFDFSISLNVPFSQTQKFTYFIVESRRENTVYSKLDVLRLVTFPPIPTNAYEVCITIVPPLWRQANESPLRITFFFFSLPPQNCASKTGLKLMRRGRGRWTVSARLTALYYTSASLFPRFHSGLKNFLLARHWINCFSSQRSLNNLRVYVGSWLNAKVKTVVWEIYYDQDYTTY